MRLQNVVAASGDVVIDLPQAVRTYQLANTNTLTMPVPARWNTLRTRCIRSHRT